MVLPLSHIPPNSDARIIWIASEPARREQLARQGFVPDVLNTKIYDETVSYTHLRAHET